MNLRVAIIHDWLLGMRGGERCLEVFLQLFPEADVYTAFLNESNLSPQLQARTFTRSSLDRIPGSKSFHRYLLPAYPEAARSIGKKIRIAHQREPYDLVISISHCLAKNVPIPKGAFHLCYCLTPMRYLWDQYDAYFGSMKLEPVVRQVVSRLRRWDVKGVENVDAFVAISDYVAARIKTVYGKESDVLYPPVRSDWLKVASDGKRGDAFLAASAFVPYKRVDAIVDAFKLLPNEKLLVVGDGPERSKIEGLAGENVELLGRVSDERLAELYRDSRALIFASEEDFGMMPVEMQASGRPVICLNKGGALETVSVGGELASGLHFSDCSPESIANAVKQFSVLESDFTVDKCIKNAEKFSLARFEAELRELLLNHGVLARNAKKALATI